MEKKEMTVYITKDGRKFFSEDEAKRYEESLLNTQAYVVRYAPDLNETGNLTKLGYLVVEARWARDLWAEDWLYKNFGSSVAFVQGSAPTWNWTIGHADLSDVEDDKILAYIKK